MAWVSIRAALGLALRVIALLVLLLIAVRAPAGAAVTWQPGFAPKPAKGSTETAAPAEIQALLNLLADPKVQAWIEKQIKAEPPVAPARPKLESPMEMMSTRVEAVREHIAELAVVVQDMPAQFAYAGDTLERTIGSRRPRQTLTLVGVFAALGYGIEALFWCATLPIRRHLEAHPVDTIGDRVRLVGERAAFALGSAAAYAVGSIGAFLLFHWPGLLRQIVLAYLIVFLSVRMAAVLGRFLLAPYNERFRVIPIDTTLARHWHLRLRLIVGWLVFALAFRGLEQSLGISPGVVNIVGACFGLCWLVARI